MSKPRSTLTSVSAGSKHPRCKDIDFFTIKKRRLTGGSIRDNLGCFPTEIYENIFSFLSLDYIVPLRQVSKSMLIIIHFWHEIQNPKTIELKISTNGWKSTWMILYFLGMVLIEDNDNSYSRELIQSPKRKMFINTAIVKTMIVTMKFRSISPQIHLILDSNLASFDDWLGLSGQFVLDLIKSIYIVGSCSRHDDDNISNIIFNTNATMISGNVCFWYEVSLATGPFRSVTEIRTSVSEIEKFNNNFSRHYPNLKKISVQQSESKNFINFTVGTNGLPQINFKNKNYV